MFSSFWTRREKTESPTRAGSYLAATAGRVPGAGGNCCHPPPTLQGQAGCTSAHHRGHSLQLCAGRGVLHVFSLVKQHLDWDALPKPGCSSPGQLAALWPSQYLIHGFLITHLPARPSPLNPCDLPFKSSYSALPLPGPGPINRKAQLTPLR